MRPTGFAIPDYKEPERIIDQYRNGEVQCSVTARERFLKGSKPREIATGKTERERGRGWKRRGARERETPYRDTRAALDRAR